MGDIVKPINRVRGVLHCGSGTYADAVVVCVDPCVLISREGDMAWYSRKIEEFEAIDTADEKTMQVVLALPVKTERRRHERGESDCHGCGCGIPRAGGNRLDAEKQQRDAEKAARGEVVRSD